MSSAPSPTIIQTAESILRIERSKWIYHERALAKRLGLSMDVLRGFMQSIGKSGGASSPPYTAIDLDNGSMDNILNLHRMQHGSRQNNDTDGNTEEPSLDAALRGLSAYYQVGRKDTRDNRVNMNIQKQLIRMVTGTSSDLDKFGEQYKTRRQEIWKQWIEESDTIMTALYNKDHLPYIALHFCRHWDVTIPPNTEARDISNTVLELVKREIVDLFVKMFIIPSSALDQFIVLRRSARTSTDSRIVPVSSRKRKHSVEESDDDSMDDDEEEDEEEEGDPDGRGEGDDSRTKAISGQLDKGPLRKLWGDGEYKRVGSLEIAAKEAHAGNNDLRSVNAKIAMLGGTAILKEDFAAIKRIDNNNNT